MNRTRNMMGAGLFTALIILSSYVTIPLGPVPVTLQTLMVLLAGFLLGPVWGPASVLVWMVLGCVGLPVFNQGQAGIVMLAGPTGGFILSFPVVAWLAGKVSRGSWAGDSLWKNFLALAGVTVVCYIIGAIGFKLSFAFFPPQAYDLGKDPGSVRGALPAPGHRKSPDHRLPGHPHPPGPEGRGDVGVKAVN